MTREHLGLKWTVTKVSELHIKAFFFLWKFWCSNRFKMAWLPFVLSHIWISHSLICPVNNYFYLCFKKLSKLLSTKGKISTVPNLSIKPHLKWSEPKILKTKTPVQRWTFICNKTEVNGSFCKNTAWMAGIEWLCCKNWNCLKAKRSKTLAKS